MIKVFEGNTANDVWQMAASEICNGKYTKHQIGRGGTTAELLHVAFAIQGPRQRWATTGSLHSTPPLQAQRLLTSGF